MMKLGLHADEGLRLAGQSLRNIHRRRELNASVQRIRTGCRLADALAETSIAGAMERSLLSVGEATGRIDEVMLQISQRNGTQLQRHTQKALSLLEPLLILGTGAMVGGIVMVMMLSIASVNEFSL